MLKRGKNVVFDPIPQKSAPNQCNKVLQYGIHFTFIYTYYSIRRPTYTITPIFVAITTADITKKKAHLFYYVEFRESLIIRGNFLLRDGARMSVRDVALFFIKPTAVGMHASSVLRCGCSLTRSPPHTCDNDDTNTRIHTYARHVR